MQRKSTWIALGWLVVYSKKRFNFHAKIKTNIDGVLEKI